MFSVQQRQLWKTSYFSSIRRDSTGQNPLQVAAETDTFYRDNSFLGQYCSRGEKCEIKKFFFTKCKQCRKWPCVHGCERMCWIKAYFSASCGWGLYVNFSSTDTMFVKVICWRNKMRIWSESVSSQVLNFNREFPNNSNTTCTLLKCESWTCRTSTTSHQKYFTCTTSDLCIYTGGNPLNVIFTLKQHLHL